ncbi:MAG: hypothetical protein KAR21_10615 [Spirochaetales bacterium]|nr:hypothetical protein [Spirochaetales bacterium]
MKRPLLFGILLLVITSSLLAQEKQLSSSLFIQQDEAKETYQCIQIRRGDKITLTGKISLYENDLDEDSESLILASDGGRVFLLKGKLLPELNQFYLTYNETERVTLKGTVLFEGWEEMPAEMEVSYYEPSEKN